MHYTDPCQTSSPKNSHSLLTEACIGMSLTLHVLRHLLYRVRGVRLLYHVVSIPFETGGGGGVMDSATCFQADKRLFPGELRLATSPLATMDRPPKRSTNYSTLSRLEAESAFNFPNSKAATLPLPIPVHEKCPHATCFRNVFYFEVFSKTSNRKIG